MVATGRALVSEQGVPNLPSQLVAHFTQQNLNMVGGDLDVVAPWPVHDDAVVRLVDEVRAPADVVTELINSELHSAAPHFRATAELRHYVLAAW